ncbi:hypothetical protein SVIOM74S_08823 [Streptomyces violarus]
MLSHALLETWRRRRGRPLMLAAYEEAGGVRGAIAATAEQVYGDLDEGQARTARRILLRLIAPGTVRPTRAARRHGPSWERVSSTSWSVWPPPAWSPWTATPSNSPTRP